MPSSHILVELKTHRLDKISWAQRFSDARAGPCYFAQLCHGAGEDLDVFKSWHKVCKW